MTETKKEKTVLDVALGIAGTLLAELGVEELAKLFKEHVVKTVKGEVAAHLSDGGDRVGIFIDIATLATSKEESDKKAGEQIRQWLLEAQGRHEEGELINLLRKFPQDQNRGRLTVLRFLGSLEDYDAFYATTTTILRHDNPMQAALKMAEGVTKKGEHVIGRNLHTVVDAAKTALESMDEHAETLGSLLAARRRKHEDAQNQKGGR